MPFADCHAPAVELVEVCRSYVVGLGRCRGVARVLAGASLAVAPGELVALVGARGAGKSTLLRCAAGLLRPDAGSVRWSGSAALPAGVLYRAVRRSPPERAEVVPTVGRLTVLALDDADASGDDRRLDGVAAWLGAVHALHPQAAVIVALTSVARARALTQRVVMLDHGRLWTLAARARVGERLPLAHVDSPPDGP